MKDALSWLLVTTAWYLIGVVLTDWMTGLAFLLFPLVIGLVAGTILARLKHHELHEFIEHDELEMAVSVTAGAAAFIAAILLVTILLPSDGQLSVLSTYWALTVPAGLALTATSYLSAKAFAKTNPTLGGLAASLAIGGVIILFGGAIVATATNYGLHEQQYAPSQLPESDIKILNDLASAHQEINRWHERPDLDPLAETSVTSLHAVIKTTLANRITHEYINAQTLLRTPPNTTQEDVQSHPCAEVLQKPVTHRQPTLPLVLQPPTNIREHFTHKLAKATTLDEMVAQIKTIIKKGNQKRHLLYRERLAGEHNESEASRAVRAQLLIDYLDEECTHHNQ